MSTAESDISYNLHGLGGEEVHKDGRNGRKGIKGRKEGRQEGRTEVSMYACSFVCYTTEYDGC